MLNDRLLQFLNVDINELKVYYEWYKHCMSIHTKSAGYCSESKGGNAIILDNMVMLAGSEEAF